MIFDIFSYLRLTQTQLTIKNIHQECMERPMKIIKFLPYLLLAWSILTPQAFAVEEEHVAKVQNVIEAFKSRNTASIAKLVSYPLYAKTNRPSINNEREFIARFHEIFNQNLLNSIVSSDARKDWNTVGWRGIMLFGGDLWLDHDGNIFSVKQDSVYASNNKNLQKKTQIVSRGRRSALHRSVNNYAQSILEWKTNNYYIRVDEMKNGRLRYASWPVNTSTTVKPDIVLSNGRLEVDKTGRNHRYVFNNGSFNYHLNVNTKNHQSPGLLEVYKGNQHFLSDYARKATRH